MTGLASIFVPIYLLLHKRKFPSAVNGIAILAAMFGMYLLTGPAGGGFNRGDFLVLLCALAFGAQIYVLGIITRGRNPLPLTFLQLATTTILAGILLPFETFQFEFSLRSVGAIVFLGIFGTAGALLIQTWAQKKTSPIKIGLILTAEPLFAYLFASALLGDYFNPVQKLGGAIIIAAVLAAEVLPLLLKSNKKAREIYARRHIISIPGNCFDAGLLEFAHGPRHFLPQDVVDRYGNIPRLSKIVFQCGCIVKRIRVVL